MLGDDEAASRTRMGLGDQARRISGVGDQGRKRRNSFLSPEEVSKPQVSLYRRGAGRFACGNRRGWGTGWAGRPGTARLQPATKFSGWGPRIYYYIFDLLCCQDRGLTRLPLVERRSLLKSLVTIQDPRIRISDYIEAGASEVLAAVREQQLEGIVGKRRDSNYEPGKRSGAWIKHRVNLPGVRHRRIFSGTAWHRLSDRWLLRWRPPDVRGENSEWVRPCVSAASIL